MALTQEQLQLLLEMVNEKARQDTFVPPPYTSMEKPVSRTKLNDLKEALLQAIEEVQ